MRKRNLVAVISILVIIITLPMISIVFDTMNHPWKWSIEEGDVLTYEVSYYGYSSSLSEFKNSEQALDENHWERDVGNPFLETKIVSLPEINLWSTAESFAGLIINHLKTVTTFLNGSAISEPFGSWVNSLISNATLPTGNWLRIQSFYANPAREYSTYTVIPEFEADLHADYFFLSYGGRSHHVIDKWDAYINLETGIPMNITERYDWTSGDGTSHGYILNLWNTE